MKDKALSIVWFRQDLRLDDNLALLHAVKRGGPLLPLYIWAPKDEGHWPYGHASCWWLQQSLHRLDEALQQKGSRLIIRSAASYLEALKRLIDESGATALYFSRRYEPAAQATESKIKTALRKANVEVESFNAGLLFEPWEIANRQGRPFRVFTPFWKTCLAIEDVAEPQGAPRRLPPVPSHLASKPLSIISPEIRHHFVAPIQPAWEPGEVGAKKAFGRFLEKGLPHYAVDRDRPDLARISHLSPHLHFNEISVRRIWKTLNERLHRSKGKEIQEHIRAFMRQLGWREFASHLLFHFPHTPQEPLYSQFAAFPWRRSPKQLTAWKEGRTGYPIVDAAIRELSYSGWMHNRARLICASFLVKDLLLPWQEGAKWFWEHLVDADLANNTLGWQWTAGCGADAAPYFRIFNPVTQGMRFDPDGVYVQTWVQELKHLPPKWIHRPWEAPPDVLEKARVELGLNYPYPIVDHEEARQSALAALSEMKQKLST